MKKIFRSLLIAISLVFILIVAGPAFSTNPVFNWRFYYRFVSFPREKPVTTVSWYEPLQIVKGNYKNPLGFAEKSEIKVSESALEKASKYAEAKNSSALIIIHQGKIILEKYWQGNNQTKTDSASMAKTIAAILTGIAIEEGKIKSENDLVSTYLEEWKNDQRSKITIKNLLQMVSGLRKYDSLINPFSDLVKMHIGFSLSDLVLNIPSAIEPGTKYEYNNVNTQIIGILIERVNGMKYHEYLSEKLWQPLELSDANLWLDHPDGTARTYCCLFTTPRDWSKIGLLLLNNGKINNKQIIPPKWLEKMKTPSLLKPTMGYFTWIGNSKYMNPKNISEPLIEKDMFFLDGRGHQKVYVIPSKQVVIVRVGENAEDWDNSFIPNTVVRGLKPALQTVSR